MEPRVHQARVEIRGSKSETEPHLLHGQARARGHSGVSPLPGTSRSVGVANGQFTSIYQHAHLPQASGMAIDHPVFTTPWPVIQRGTARSRTISWPFRQRGSPWPQQQQGRSRPLPRPFCDVNQSLCVPVQSMRDGKLRTPVHSDLKYDLSTPRNGKADPTLSQCPESLLRPRPRDH